LLGIIPSLLLAYLMHNPLLLICWAVALGLAQLVFYIGYSRRHFDLGFDLRQASRARAREMAAYTGKTFATLIFNAVFGTIDRFVLGRLAAPAGFAHYTIASNAGARVQSLSVAVMGPVFHNTSRAIGAKGETSAAEVYNHTFDFTFGWYVLLAVWTSLWHPVLLRLWLGKELGAAVAPVFCPIVVAYCLTAVSNISGAQLGPLNRVGTGLFFNVLTVLMLGLGVYAGWRLGGVTGVACGFLASRLPLFIQDIFVIRLIGGGGWLKLRTWLELGAQCLVGAGFATSYLLVPRGSLWLLVPAVLHGAAVAGWLAREPLRRLLAGAATAHGLSPDPAPPVAKG
jgi:O-antigen/teichoic acid export membrane protein